MIQQYNYNSETKSFSIDKDKAEEQLIEHADRAANRAITGQTERAIRRADGIKVGTKDKIGAVKNAVKGKFQGKGGRANAVAELASKKVSAYAGATGVTTENAKKAAKVAGATGAVVGEGSKLYKKYTKGNIFGVKRKPTLGNIANDAILLAKRAKQGAETGDKRSDKVLKGVNDEKISTKLEL